MKNIVHTLTLAQMRANPRRTLVTLVGVVLTGGRKSVPG